MAVEITLTTRPGAADCLQRLDRLRTSVLGAVVLPALAGKPTRPLPEVSSSRPVAPRPRSEARSEARAESRPDLASKAQVSKAQASKAQGSASSGSQLAPPLASPAPFTDSPPPGSRSPGSRSPGSRSSSTRSSGSQQSDSLPGSRAAPVGTNARAGRGDDVVPWPEPPDKISEG
jgi:hypothetical protein